MSNFFTGLTASVEDARKELGALAESARKAQNEEVMKRATETVTKFLEQFAVSSFFAGSHGRTPAMAGTLQKAGEMVSGSPEALIAVAEEALALLAELERQGGFAAPGLN